MCETGVQAKYETQKLSVTLEEIPVIGNLYNSKIKLSYKDPSGIECKFNSGSGFKYVVNGNQSFEPTSTICDNGNYLGSKGRLQIESLSSGPFISNDNQFKNIYFHFKNIIIHMDVRFCFNPLSLCVKDFDAVYVSDKKRNGSLMNLIDNEKNVFFDKYFVTNGPDESNVNTSLYNLEPLFKDYKSPFHILYDGFIDVYSNLSTFSDSIRNQYVKMLCEHRKTNPYNPKPKNDAENNPVPSKMYQNDEQFENPYIHYHQKIKQIKNMDLYSTLFTK